MIKVYQTIVDPGKGNCTQAAIASLFDLPLKKVPNFIEYGTRWFSELYSFIGRNKYSFDGTLYNPRIQGSGKRHDRFQEIKEMEGVNGYFLASVYSPKYFNRREGILTQHSVLIDKDLNVVHDPNPEYAPGIKYPEYEKLGYGGILDIFMINPAEVHETIQ